VEVLATAVAAVLMHVEHVVAVPFELVEALRGEIGWSAVYPPWIVEGVVPDVLVAMVERSEWRRDGVCRNLNEFLVHVREGNVVGIVTERIL